MIPQTIRAAVPADGQRWLRESGRAATARWSPAAQRVTGRRTTQNFGAAAVSYPEPTEAADLVGLTWSLEMKSVSARGAYAGWASSGRGYPGASVPVEFGTGLG